MILNNREAVEGMALELKERNKKIVTAGGCFDLLHMGHVDLLEQSAKLGDTLWVLTNTDASLSALKPGRPILPLLDRQKMLDALRSVCFVSSFSEETPCEIMEIIKPDIHIKGGEYRGKWMPETEVIQRWGGCIEHIDMLGDYSTTSLIDRILASK